MKLQLFPPDRVAKCSALSCRPFSHLFQDALKVRSNMFPINHEGEQIGVVERWTQSNSNHSFVITADKETGVAVNIMRCNDAYIKRNFKK